MTARQTLRVMTYNIQGHAAHRREHHLLSVAEVIKSAKVDVVALQEVHRRTSRSLGIDQLQVLSDETGMEPSFGKSRTTEEHGEFGNAVLSRLPLLTSRTHALPGGGEPRTLLETELLVDQIRLHLFVTHLTAWGPLGRRNRRKQTAMVASIVEQSRLPFILTGDFNSTPSSTELREFHSSRIVSSCLPAGSVTYRTTRQCLDYIFLDKRCSFENATVLQTGPSDHWPLVVEVRLPENDD